LGTLAPACFRLRRSGSGGITALPQANLQSESPEHLAHVFERFYRVDEARSDGGAGIGLSIARQVAEAHGGAISVSSAPQEGSTFVLRIPVDSRAVAEVSS